MKTYGNMNYLQNLLMEYYTYGGIQYHYDEISVKILNFHKQSSRLLNVIVLKGIIGYSDYLFAMVIFECNGIFVCNEIFVFLFEVSHFTHFSSLLWTFN